MATRPLCSRITILWIFLTFVITFLLGYATVRQYRHSALLFTHIKQLQHDNLNVKDEKVGYDNDAPAADELATRSRRSLSSMLGLANSTGRGRALESAKWKPLILRTCTEDMPPYYAPCLARVIPTMEYGEELIYPDFEAALPGFFDASDAALWVSTNYGPSSQGQTGANKRVVLDDRQGRLVFIGLRGQNLIFKNQIYRDAQVPSTWMSDSSHCLGHMTATTPWNAGNASDADVAEAGRWVEEAAVYVTPDSERYQHWLDHTTKVLMQSAHLISEKTLILPGQGLSSKQDIVKTMWDWLPHIKKSQIQATTGDVATRRLITSCRVPYVHPYLFFRLQEMVLGPESPRVPLSERKVVVWYSRNEKDYHRSNSGRMIMNEDAAKAAIAKLLKERGLGERLEVHPPKDTSQRDPLSYIHYLNRNVAAMIGPHGGGLCNFKWLASGALVLELMPSQWISTPLYEEAIGHGLNYWVDIRPSLDNHHNMEANVSRIIAMLRAELGKEPKRGPILRYRYDWPAAMDDTLGSNPQASTYFESLKGKCCNSAQGEAGEGYHVLEG